MSAPIIAPRRLQVGGHAWQLCIDLARRIVTDDASVLDARQLEFAQPFGLVMLASAAIQRAVAGMPALSFVPPTSRETREFLDEVGFGDFMETASAGAPPTRAPTPLSIRRLSATSLDPSFIAGVARTLERLVPGTSESVAYNVELSLNELLLNVTEHAHSPVDCVVHARWYAAQQNLRLAVADAGIGLVASLQTNPKYRYFGDDARLVAHALTVPGVTSRTSGRFGGFGLKSLRDFVVKRGGELNVATGIVFARVDPAGAHTDFGPRLHGTTIELDFRPLVDDGSREQPKDEDLF